MFLLLLEFCFQQMNLIIHGYLLILELDGLLSRIEYIPVPLNKARDGIIGSLPFFI